MRRQAQANLIQRYFLPALAGARCPEEAADQTEYETASYCAPHRILFGGDGSFGTEKVPFCLVPACKGDYGTDGRAK